ncbi:hypothetical protein D3H65_26645 [Paraflavitalea soli]|uniref:Esterase-like activity of phytase family protein n=1 Tax=Paraflavitalea soli TaxID=2315862 RepID=A0A3B7MWD2_9BACT|nr:hypothetical protein [Paraflavitalea soli]AXY77340.1 hypothetical protein D3H65_26645 [Paraflavitalea soli]
MKRILSLLAMGLAFNTSGQTYHFSNVALGKSFSKALQISSIASVDDSLYLPAEKCGKIYIGKIVSDSLRYRTASMTVGATEGLAYHNGFFYTSDDAANVVRKYNKTFSQQPVEYIIDFNGFQHKPTDGNGFEGVAVLNDTTIVLLLEKVKSLRCAVLYRGIIRADKIVLVEQRLLGVVTKERYCDLHYRNDTLFLLKSAYFGERTRPFLVNNCNQENNYSIRYLEISPKGNSQEWLTGTPSLLFSLKKAALDNCNAYNTNIEGIAADVYGNFYAVSDNLYANGLCDVSGENKTLLLKIQRHK